MLVIVQEWSTEDGFKTSISKDEAHLAAKVREMKKSHPDAVTTGGSSIMELHDERSAVAGGLAEMVEFRGTVFLRNDERDLLSSPELP